MLTIARHDTGTLDFVRFLTDVPQQKRIGDAQGVIPSNRTADAQFTADNPKFDGFAAGADYAQGEPTPRDFRSVMDEFDSQLLDLAAGEDPRRILIDTQRNAARALGR